MTCLYAFFDVDRQNFESKVVLAQWVSAWRTTTPFRGARLLEEEQEQGERRRRRGERTQEEENDEEEAEGKKGRKAFRRNGARYRI